MGSKLDNHGVAWCMVCCAGFGFGAQQRLIPPFMFFELTGKV
jgi:hypothetical protein